MLFLKIHGCDCTSFFPPDHFPRWSPPLLFQLSTWLWLLLPFIVLSPGIILPTHNITAVVPALLPFHTKLHDEDNHLEVPACRCPRVSWPLRLHCVEVSFIPAARSGNRQISIVSPRTHKTHFTLLPESAFHLLQTSSPSSSSGQTWLRQSFQPCSKLCHLCPAASPSHAATSDLPADAHGL